MRILLSALGVVFLLSGAARGAGDTASEEALSLNLQKMSLGTLTGVEEKRQYLTTIQLEKQRVQAHMLRGIYDNAFDLYRSGDYERAQELANKILAIDPNFADAKILAQASGTLKGSPTKILSERAMLEDKFKEGLMLYQDGRVVEAASKWDEVVKLSPGNMKASYWLRKARTDIADAHIRRGVDYYNNGQLREAIDQWYNALMIKKNDPKLMAEVAKAEEELKGQEIKELFKQGIQLYSENKLVQSYKTFEKVLELEPGNSKAIKHIKDVKDEIASGYIEEGKRSYKQRQYTAAIESWEKAGDYGYNQKYVGNLIARAKEQMRLEEEDAKKREEMARKDALEAAEREKKIKEEEQRKKMQEELSLGSDKGKSNVVTEENKKAAQQHYINGLIAMQNGEYEKARDEWTLAKQLDPNNSDADAGLKRIEQMMSSSQ